jgi:hypothetical protein
MLGVLLDTARPGQRTPGLGQAVNLAACGLAIRVRRIPGWLAADAGQDALAVVSLIAPAVVVIFLVLQRAAISAAVGARVPVWVPVPVPFPFLFLFSVGESVVVMIAWLAVVLLGLAGLRRTAAAIASISLTFTLLALLTAIMQPIIDSSGGIGQLLVLILPFGDVPVVLASLAACSLVFSPGPRRGLAIVGWRRACLMIAGLSAGFGFPSIVQLVDPAAPMGDLHFRLLGGQYALMAGDLEFRLLGVLAIAVAVVVTCVRVPVGRRVAGLVATGLLPSLALTIPLPHDRAVFLVPLLVSLLAAVLVWPVAIISWGARVLREGYDQGRRARRPRKPPAQSRGGSPGVWAGRA